MSVSLGRVERRREEEDILQRLVCRDQKVEQTQQGQECTGLVVFPAII